MQSKSQPKSPPQAEIDAWFDHPVTNYVAALAENLYIEADVAVSTQGYDAENAARLMASRANLFGILEVAHIWRDTFKQRSFEYLAEEDNGEHVGDLPQR